MDQETLVIEQTTGGRKLLERLAASGFEVTAAFWTKTDEDDQWYLYIVTPVVETRGPLEAYRQIRRAIAACQWADAAEAIDISTVKVLETTHSLARGVADVLRRYPGPFDTWYRITWVGDAAVSGMFIYSRIPAPTPQPAGS